MRSSPTPGWVQRENAESCSVLEALSWLSGKPSSPHRHDYLCKNSDRQFKKTHTNSQNRSTERESPVLNPIMSTWTFVSFVCLWAFSWERRLLLLNYLSQVEHGVEPVVHHLDGREEDGHHGRVHARHDQAGREGLGEKDNNKEN